ncbi:MAG: roadblock/LC7 domain-containing protein, partial [Spirochaetes bacterium]|nr:roadblock/LC7 domain-containing protein [Spirochaetota bacterium]
MSAKIEKLGKILNVLENDSEIFTSALVSKKGQLMASGSRLKNLDENALAAMSAALTSVGARVGVTLSCGDLKSLLITAEERIVIATALSNGVLIA